MNKRLSVGLAGAALLLLSGGAQAACEDMRVIVRNTVYPIRGLEAFCTEFNKMKADLTGMRSELTIANSENAMLRARLTGTSVQAGDEKLVRIHPVQQKESQTGRVRHEDNQGHAGVRARNRFLLVAGKQLNEPVARTGPSVMNTRQEVMDALQDFREGRF